MTPQLLYAIREFWESKQGSGWGYFDYALYCRILEAKSNLKL